MSKKNDDAERVELHDSLRRHPGEFLRYECIRAAGLTVKETAERLGISRAGLNRILAGEGRITPRLALSLENDFGWSTAEMWLRMQVAYDLAQERIRQAA